MRFFFLHKSQRYRDRLPNVVRKCGRFLTLLRQRGVSTVFSLDFSAVREGARADIHTDFDNNHCVARIVHQFQIEDTKICSHQYAKRSNHMHKRSVVCGNVEKPHMKKVVYIVRVPKNNLLNTKTTEVKI